MKLRKRIVTMALIGGMMLSSISAGAKTWVANTEKGNLGRTEVKCKIERTAISNSTDQVLLQLKANNKVEQLGINDINVIKGNGSGTHGASVSEANKYSVTFTRNYKKDSVVSISAHFYINSNNFGRFSKVYAC